MNEIFAMGARLNPGLHLAVGLVIAAGVSIHVLLTKSDVKAAAGWIALLWFAPIIGAIVYLLFGVNRVQRRARRLRRRVPHAGRGSRAALAPSDDDGHLDPLRKSVGFITDRPSEPGNAVRVLHNGDEAYPVMLAAIGAARVSVALSSYIMRDDTIGTAYIAALQAAQARGVQVRVIVDGVGSGWMASPAFRHLRAAGIPAERFMHSAMPWRMPFLNLRSHKKILVIDGTLGFTGGINIADQNVLATNPKDPVQDTHFELRGPVVTQLAEAFAQDWQFVSDEVLDGPVWFPRQTHAGDAMARVVTAGPDQDLEKIEYTVLQAIACARRSIQVMTPYFLPDQPVMTALSLAAMRGVTVDVIVPAHSDHRLVDWAMGANIGALLHDGGRMWRCPSPFRHSKMMVVDGEWSLVGSSNWDMRSFRLNFELCVEFYDRSLARELEALMHRCRGTALLDSEIAARTRMQRLRDAAVRLLLPYL